MRVTHRNPDTHGEFDIAAPPEGKIRPRRRFTAVLAVAGSAIASIAYLPLRKARHGAPVARRVLPPHRVRLPPGRERVAHANLALSRPPVHGTPNL
jgi:hypothetical protein